MILTVGNTEFKDFSKFQINLNFDTLGSTFSFDVSPYNFENPDHKKLFELLTFQKCNIRYNDQLILTGELQNVVREQDANECVANVTGASKPIVLAQCNMPLDFDFQSNNLTLRQISEKIASAFGLSVKFSPVAEQLKLADVEYESDALEPTVNPSNYLASMATQAGMITRHDEEGRLLFTKPDPNDKILARYEIGQMPVLKMRVVAAGTNMHSEISAIGQTSITKEGQREGTETNELVKANRPITVTQTRGEDTESKTAAQQVRARELKSISATITCSQWTINDLVMIPGDMVEILAPKLGILQPQKMMVLNNRLELDAEGERSTVTLVLHEALSGLTPVLGFD